jgi:hypothetical protein
VGGIVPEEYPYVTSASRLQEFLERLGETGIPQKINQKWLESLGYKSKNDRRFLGVLRFLGLIDSSGTPTEAYRSTLRRGAQGRAEFAKLIRESYADLFATYPDAHRKDNEALQNFFTAHTDVGSKAVQLMASTFKTICTFSDFEGEVGTDANGLVAADYSNGSAEVTSTPIPSKVPNISNSSTTNTLDSVAQPLVINVNIQLEIPTTSDGQVYDSLFKSMAKHILRLSDKQ